jgi:hypothetical protein
MALDFPRFEDEAEEARWLFEHREELARDAISAIREGKFSRNSRTAKQNVQAGNEPAGDERPSSRP